MALLPRLLLILVSGGAVGAGYWPGPWGVFAWVSFVPLLWVIRDASPRRALLWGTVFGGAMFAGATPWFYDVVRRWLDFPWPARALCFLVFCAYHGLRAGLACGAGRWLAQRWSQRRGMDPTTAMAAFMVPALVAVEGFLPMQFPAQLADTQFFHLPTVQLVEWAGVAGVAWLVVGFNAALFYCLRSRQESSAQFRRSVVVLACAACALALNEAWGRWRIAAIDAQAGQRIAEGRALRVGLVQGRLPHDKDYLRFSHERELHAHNLEAFNRLSRSARESGPLDLLIWPGNILPDIPEYESADAFAPALGGRPLGEFLRRKVVLGVPTMFYTVGRARGSRRWIAVLAGASREPLAVAEKMILTPFGDYTPGERLFPILRRLNPNTRAMTRGDRPRVVPLGDKARLAVLICYEDLFPGYAGGFVRMGSDLFVDVAGNSWDDETMLPRQHLRFAAMRAVENRRYLLRSAISGVSAVVDPAGRIVQSIGAREEGTIAATVALMDGRPLSVAVGRGLYHLALGLLAALAFACGIPPLPGKAGPAPAGRPAGLKAIVLYNGAKGTLELAAALSLMILISRGDTGYLQDAVDSLRRHFVNAWSIRLAAAALALVESHIRLVAFALAADGSLHLAQWWCLRGGRSWGEWLVIGSMGSLLPFEVFELFKGVHLGRLLAFVLNAGIVAYLARRRLSERRAG